MSPREYEILHEQIEELLRKGDIPQYESMLIPKRDGSWRMCIDSWAIKKITVKFMFPIPCISDLLDQLNGASIFSKLDLQSGGYHHIQIRLGD